ncbi:ubiquitin carboxyl-terminal hydrolase 47-like [Dysidea avara]|uniref:ubiquitin carboxyl-terminal hydrolase 47-like n=1 Tax=Dysidea avara TaxID=196820 RepID=UPI0033281AA5
MVTEVTCDSCQNISKATFQCNHLNIPVYPIQVFNSPFSKAIVEQLNKTEDLDGLNKYYCERCQKKTCAEIKYCAKSLPEIFIVHIKR